MVQVEITKEDRINILKWLTAASIMVEAGTRTKFSDSEHKTAEKINWLRIE